MMHFTLNITPPTVTHQMKRVRVVRGKPMFYEDKRLKAARELFMDALAWHKPSEPLTGAIRLTVQWAFYSKSHKAGTWRTTRPDTDNLQKLLKDCMTRSGYWFDDAQVCAEYIIKSWESKPYIDIEVTQIDQF